jgi:hypothetical protein
MIDHFFGNDLPNGACGFGEWAFLMDVICDHLRGKCEFSHFRMGIMIAIPIYERPLKVPFRIGDKNMMTSNLDRETIDIHSNGQGLYVNATPLLYFKDFYNWPRDWMEFETDLEVGNGILQEFIPFIEHLVQKGLSKSTIKKYMTDLGVLGSEIIRRIHDSEDQRKWPASVILLSYIDDSGGPLPYCWDTTDFTEQRYITAYDSVCRKLYKFVTKQV